MDPDAPDCKNCLREPADVDGFCSDACYHLYREKMRKGALDD
jgi:hypothetical protein